MISSFFFGGETLGAGNVLFLSLRVDIQWWFFLQFYRVSDVYLCLEMV